MHEMGRVLDENAALLERFTHKAPVARILHVAHAAVNELGRTRGSARGEVLRFKQQGLEAAGGCINGNAGAGCAAADDDDVPKLVFAQLRECVFSNDGFDFFCHGHWFHLRARPTARAHWFIKDSL